jgi:hypothetical protein
LYRGISTPVGSIFFEKDDDLQPGGFSKGPEGATGGWGAGVEERVVSQGSSRSHHVKSVIRGSSVLVVAGLLGLAGCGAEEGTTGPTGTIPADAPRTSEAAKGQAPPNPQTQMKKGGGGMPGNMPAPPDKPR